MKGTRREGESSPKTQKTASHFPKIVAHGATMQGRKIIRGETGQLQKCGDFMMQNYPSLEKYL
jgi:hypothetical protein